jgi:hypothetical protein
LQGSTSGPTAHNCPNGWSYLPTDCTGMHEKQRQKLVGGSDIRADGCRSSSTNCTTCTANAGCGYCTGTATCRAGTAVAPTTPCALGQWLFSTCPACAVQTTCSSCTVISGCGWCDDRCVSASQNGPSNGNTTCSFFTYYNTFCSLVLVFASLHDLSVVFLIGIRIAQTEQTYYGLAVGIPVGVVGFVFLLLILRACYRNCPGLHANPISPPIVRAGVAGPAGEYIAVIASPSGSVRTVSVAVQPTVNYSHGVAAYPVRVLFRWSLFLPGLCDLTCPVQAVPAAYGQPSTPPIYHAGQPAYVPGPVYGATPQPQPSSTPTYGSASEPALPPPIGATREYGSSASALPLVPVVEPSQDDAVASGSQL